MRAALVLVLGSGIVAAPIATPTPAPTPAACEHATTTKIGGRGIVVANKADRLFFGVGSLELDFDGSPVAYGVRDEGQENICVGLAPKNLPCRGQFRGICYKVCQQTFAAWSNSGRPPAALADTMCSVGLGGSGCSVPDARLQSPPKESFFISETSLKTAPAAGSSSAAWLRSQDAQLDPARIRYLVVPGSLMKPPFGVRLGDVGIGYNAANQVAVPFIVGDGGGLGEGSVSLLQALLPSKPPALTKATNAFGQKVDRYTSGIAGDFRFVIFKGTAALVPGSARATQHAAAQLPAWIDQTAKAALDARSSYAEVAACSRHAATHG